MATTIFQATAPTGVSAGQGGFSFRSICTGLVAGTGGSATQIRVTFSASSIDLKDTHCSIGLIVGGSTASPNCTNITTLTFSSAAPLSILAAPSSSLTAQSDWVTSFPAFTTSDGLLIDQDCDPAGSGNMNTGAMAGGLGANAITEFYSAAGVNPPGDYNQNSVTGYSGNAANRGIVLIEIQPVSAPTVTLMGAICL